jgi:DNA-binding MarR family transcriptional regulator
MTLEELKENPGYQLWLVTNAWQRSMRKALQPMGLTHVQFVVLASVGRLCGVGEIVTQAEVCRWGSLDANMASEVVRSLEGRGLLVRLEHPTDRRAHRLELTEDGKALFTEARAALMPVKKAFFSPLPDEGKALAGILAQLVQANEG